MVAPHDMNKLNLEDWIMFSIETIMSTNVITVPASATLAEARSLMHDNRIHHLPVTEGKSLVGILTLTDLLAATDSFLRDKRNRIHANEIIVGDVMMRDVRTVNVNASLRQAALYIEKHQIGCLPVMRGSKLVGIITDTDFVAVAINLLEQIESTEPLDDDFGDDLDDLSDLDGLDDFDSEDVA
jgi:CBS domain-containing protein